MTEVWPRISVGSLVQAREASLQTGPFGTQLSASEYVPEGIPVINVRNVGFGDVRADDLEYVSEGKAEQLHHHVLRVGDIVFGRKGAVERHALIGAAQDGWVQGSDCLRLRLQSPRFNVRFVSFYLRTKGHQDWMLALCSFGATMSSLNQDIVNRIELPCPPRPVQAQIAAVLAAYDDLIANNQRRIALLESMAEEIYREWFVRMRFPGYEDTPNAGGLPVGWTLRRLSDVATVNASSIRPGAEPELVAYLDISAVGTNSFEEPTRMKHQDAPGRARRLVRDGDIIWSSVRPGNKTYCLILDPPENLVASTGFAVISPKPGTPFSYLSKAVTTQEFTNQMVAVAKGAAYPATSFDDFEKAQIVWPSSELLTTFHKRTEPMLRQVALLRAQNRVLAQQRNSLLPRLISGKLRIEALDIQFPPSMQPPPAEAAPREAIAR